MTNNNLYLITIYDRSNNHYHSVNVERASVNITSPEYAYNNINGVNYTIPMRRVHEFNIKLFQPDEYFSEWFNMHLNYFNISGQSYKRDVLLEIVSGDTKVIYKFYGSFIIDYNHDCSNITFTFDYTEMTEEVLINTLAKQNVIENEKNIQLRKFSDLPNILIDLD